MAISRVNHLNIVGFVIVGLFAPTWVTALKDWRLAKVETAGQAQADARSDWNSARPPVPQPHSPRPRLRPVCLGRELG